jgi:DNA polymerase-1
LSKRLVELKRDLFTVETFDTEQYLVRDVDYDAAVPLFQEIGMRSIIKELGRASNGDGAAPAPPKAEVKTQAGTASYVAVTDLAQVKRLFDEAVQAGGVMAFDLETTGLDEMTAQVIRLLVLLG